MRLIDADALSAKIYNDIPIKVFGSLKRMGAIREIVDDMPTIEAKPIVRCKDCKWWAEIEGSEGVYGYCMAIRHCYFTRNWDIEIHRKYDKDFYCADGKRRDDDETD